MVHHVFQAFVQLHENILKVFLALQNEPLRYILWHLLKDVNKHQEHNDKMD